MGILTQRDSAGAVLLESVSGFARAEGEGEGVRRVPKENATYNGGCVY